MCPPLGINWREQCGPPSGKSWAPLVRSSNFKQQLGKHLAFKCSDHLPLQHSFRPFPLTFNYFHVISPPLHLCTPKAPPPPLSHIHGGCNLEPQTHPSLDLFPEGKGPPALLRRGEALFYCCLWLIGFLRPDILQNSLHKQPGKLRGTERASGWMAYSIEVRCKTPFDFSGVRVLPYSFNEFALL